MNGAVKRVRLMPHLFITIRNIHLLNLMQMKHIGFARHARVKDLVDMTGLQMALVQLVALTQIVRRVIMAENIQTMHIMGAFMEVKENMTSSN